MRRGATGIAIALLLTALAVTMYFGLAQPTNVGGPDDSVANINLGRITVFGGTATSVALFLLFHLWIFGARRAKRLRANARMVEVLLRRLVSEPGFQLNSEEIDRFASGTALEFGIKREFLFAVDQLLTLMYFKVIDNDFIPEKRRVSTLQKVEICLNSTALNDDGIGGLGRKAFVKKDILLFLGLGLGAIVPVCTLVAIASPMLDQQWSNASTFVQTNVLGSMVSILVATGAVGLLIFLKDRESEGSLSDRMSNSFAHHVLQRLRPTRLHVNEEPGIGLVLEVQSGRIILDAKRDAPSLSQASLTVKRMQKALPALNCARGYLVVGAGISNELRDLSTDDVRVVTIDEFMRSLTTPLAVGGSPSIRTV